MNSARTDEYQPPGLDLSEEDVQQLAEELLAYHRDFADLFQRKEQAKWGLKYLQGLLVGNNRCAEGIALSVPDVVLRDIQRFVGQGMWDDEAILQRHAELVTESLGQADGVLIIDGSEFPKKGRYSVGVARQWCGTLGKVDNCQAGVFLGYASSRGHTLVDRRLYLPNEWFSAASAGRWDRCRIPDDVEFRSKPELAWDMVEQALQQGVLPFQWITFDEGYGDNPQLLDRLSEADIQYFADVSCSTRVWPQAREIEPCDCSEGDAVWFSKEHVEGKSEPVRVDELRELIPEDVWSRYRVKQGEKGPIKADFAFVRARAVRNGVPGPEVWVVFRRSLGENPEWKYFLSNAPADIELDQLVRVTGMRWPIEVCFKEAKGTLGMDEYQTRSWLGWHHHMTLVILAHHFLVRVQLKHKKGHRS